MALCLLTSLPLVHGEEPDHTVSDDFGESRYMVTKLPDEVVLKNLREEDYAKMTLDDPLLHAAYVEVLCRTYNILSGENLRPEFMSALNDMKRRGNDVTPVLLKLMKENPYTRFEITGLKAAYIEKIDPQPYLEYAREALKTRWKTLQASDVGNIALFLMRKGGPSDVELLREAARKRPYLADEVESTIALFSKYSKPKKQPNPIQAKQPEATPGSRDSQNKSWLVGLLVVVAAAIGAAWLLLRKSKS